MPGELASMLVCLIHVICHMCKLSGKSQLSIYIALEVLAVVTKRIFLIFRDLLEKRVLDLSLYSLAVHS